MRKVMGVYSVNSLTEQSQEPEAKRGWGQNFWRFHVLFWCVATFIMFLAGLSQPKTFEVALVRNTTYGLLGFFATLLLPPVFDRLRMESTLRMLFLCLVSSYLIGVGVTLLVNPISAALGGTLLWDLPWPRWFAGSLNFSLVVLVWSGLYLALKLGLRFVEGEEAHRAAQAISSISSHDRYPEFLALERNKKIVLLPVNSIAAIQGAGDYVEISTDDGDFLKRESLKNMADMLDPQMFQRVHRSAIVNLHAIRELEPKGKGDFTLILKSGTKIASSRGYMKDFKTRFSGLV